ncbi:MAG TPA: tetratricopeptide repeat protein, partial [Candidatus Marinimicrobia bacterium]|nr:tetratricopeptide repeat protein [Candidatus Neomarinimicrobiota bacterium]
YGNYAYQYLNYQAKFFDDPENMIYRDKAAGLRDAHSEFVHVLSETGIVGLLIFISVFALFFGYARTLMEDGLADEKRLCLQKCIIASVLVIGIHALVDNVLHVLPVALLFYCGAAVISAEMRGRDKPLVNFSLKGNLLLPVAVIALLTLNGYFVVNRLAGYVFWKKGQDSVHQGKWEQGINYYQRALDYIPENAELQFHLGAAYSYTGAAEQAIGLLTSSLKSFNDKNIYLTLGHAYRISGEYQKAEDNFRTVTRMYPQMLLPHLWLAELYYEMGDRDQSIQELRLIINAKPKILSDDVILIKHDAERFLRIILKAE